MISVIIAIVSVVFVAIATVIAVVQWRENHSDRVDDKFKDAVKHIIREEITALVDPLHDSLNNHTVQISQNSDRLSRVESLQNNILTRQQEFSDAQARMGVKVDMYWTSLEQLAMNSAKNLHQPDPLRARVDHLLESFMEGTLSDSERNELKKTLVKIRNYEQVNDAQANYEKSVAQLGFPVHPGEQTAAAILLSTMDLVEPGRMAAMGHAEHRSVAHKEDNPDA